MEEGVRDVFERVCVERAGGRAGAGLGASGSWDGEGRVERNGLGDWERGCGLGASGSWEREQARASGSKREQAGASGASESKREPEAGARGKRERMALALLPLVERVSSNGV